MGQIPHLPLLLGIEALGGVQWIHGDGKPDSAHWPEVFGAIQQGKKLIQVTSGDFAALDAICGQIGTLKGVHYRGMLWSEYGLNDEAKIRSELTRFGIE